MRGCHIPYSLVWVYDLGFRGQSLGSGKGKGRGLLARVRSGACLFVRGCHSSYSLGFGLGLRVRG